MGTREAVRSIASMVIVTVVFFVAERDVAAGEGGYESEQGTRIFGTRDPTLEGVQILYVPKQDTPELGYQSLSIDAGQLHVIGAGVDVSDSRVVGTKLAGTQLPKNPGGGSREPVTLIVLKASPHENIYNCQRPENIWEYEIAVERGKKQVPLCNDDHNRALVVPGAWKDGQLSTKDDHTWFTFACVPIPVRDPASTSCRPKSTRHGGAAAKCIDYGYPPWAKGVPALGQVTRLGTKMPEPSDAIARQFHNMCTHAMIADYFGNGASHTISESEIRIFDLTNVPVELCRIRGSSGIRDSSGIPCTHATPGESSAPSPSPAAKPASPPDESPAKSSLTWMHATGTTPRWDEVVTGGGYARVATKKDPGLFYEAAWTVDHGKARALCLSKARWTTIDPSDPKRLPVHDFTDKGKQKGPTYCDALTFSDIAAFGSSTPLLITYSAINERGLYRFNLGTEASPRWITTSHVELTDRGDVDISGGIRCDGRCKDIPAKFEGDVLSPTEPRKAFKGFPTVALYLYKNDSGNYATATVDTAPPGYTRGPLEGYLFKPDFEPDLPASRPGLFTDPQAQRLSLWKRPGKYYTALSHFVSRGDDPGHPLGYVLLPAAMRSFTPLSYAVPDARDPDPPDPRNERVLDAAPGIEQGATQQPAPRAAPQPAPR